MISSFGDLAPYVKNAQIAVRVTPRSSRSEIEAWDEKDQLLRIRVRSPPDNDRANKEVLLLLKKICKKKVVIVHGKKSRNKIIQFLE